MVESNAMYLEHVLGRTVRGLFTMLRHLESRVFPRFDN